MSELLEEEFDHVILDELLSLLGLTSGDLGDRYPPRGPAGGAVVCEDGGFRSAGPSCARIVRFGG